MIETFDSTKTRLTDILKQISEGKTQLPDFQRGWVWDDERIVGLLASIAMSYPIGAIMLLETGNQDVRFKPRPIQGSEGNGNPEFFILDGQQRLTTLFQTLNTDKVVETIDTKKRAIRRWYYFDIQKSLDKNQDILDAIISIPEDKKITKDFGREILFSCGTEELEFEKLVFPVNKLLNSTDWFNKYMKYWKYDQPRIEKFQEFQEKIIKRFEGYQLPVIKLFKHNPKDAVCQVFEKVNTGGVSLTVFELLTATYAADNFNLRDDWKKKKKDFDKHEVLKDLSSNELLQAISLFSTIERKEKLFKEGVSSENLPAVSCKKKDVLKITLDTYKQWADIASKAFIESAKLLLKSKIFKSKDLPYSTQLVPLAVIMGRLGDKSETEGVKQKILKWYWNGVLGELYGGANETRFAKDAIEVVEWIEKDTAEPSSIRDAYFAEDRLLTLKTRNSAAYKGMFILLMQAGAKDFRTGDAVEWANYFDDAIDIHHVFPQKWCDDNGISPEIYNSIINKTPLSPRTNRMIGGRAPSEYLDTIYKTSGIDEKKLIDIMSSHFIPTELLKSNDFNEFMEKRKESILEMIEKVMGKKVQHTINIE